MNNNYLEMNFIVLKKMVEGHEKQIRTLKEALQYWQEQCSSGPKDTEVQDEGGEEQEEGL